MPSELIVLDKSGDVKMIWDGEKKKEVDAAKKMFDDMKKNGYLAYTVDREGEKGEVIFDFHPQAEKIIMTPQMQGG